MSTEKQLVQKVSITVVNKKCVKKYYPQKFEQGTKKGKKTFSMEFFIHLKLGSKKSFDISKFERNNCLYFF